MVKLFDTKSLTKMMLNWSTYNCWFSFYFWRIFNFSLQGSDNSDILALQKARSKRQSNQPETFWWAAYPTIRILKTLDHLFSSFNFFFYLFDMFYDYFYRDETSHFLKLLAICPTEASAVRWRPLCPGFLNSLFPSWTLALHPRSLPANHGHWQKLDMDEN